MKLHKTETSSEVPADLLIKRFPDHKNSILNYYNKSAVFRDICSDYDDLSSWLERNPTVEGQSSVAHTHAIELLDELASEAIDFLRRQRPELWR